MKKTAHLEKDALRHSRDSPQLDEDTVASSASTTCYEYLWMPLFHRIGEARCRRPRTTSRYVHSYLYQSRDPRVSPHLTRKAIATSPKPGAALVRRIRRLGATYLRPERTPKRPKVSTRAMAQRRRDGALRLYDALHEPMPDKAPPKTSATLARNFSRVSTTTTTTAPEIGRSHGSAFVG